MKQNKENYRWIGKVNVYLWLANECLVPDETKGAYINNNICIVDDHQTALTTKFSA